MSSAPFLQASKACPSFFQHLHKSSATIILIFPYSPLIYPNICTLLAWPPISIRRFVAHYKETNDTHNEFWMETEDLSQGDNRDRHSDNASMFEAVANLRASVHRNTSTFQEKLDSLCDFFQTSNFVPFVWGYPICEVSAFKYVLINLKMSLLCIRRGWPGIW